MATHIVDFPSAHLRASKLTAQTVTQTDVPAFRDQLTDGTLAGVGDIDYNANPGAYSGTSFGTHTDPHGKVEIVKISDIT